MASQAEENYLKALFTLSEEGGDVNISQLSNMLQVTKPTTNSMVKNLQKQGLVIYERYRPLKLTDDGRKAAARVIRKHRLTEMYLVEKMGFGWEEVHAIAEQVEHIDSPVLFDRMDELMGYPTADPHGSPIPDKEGGMEHLTYKPLSECKPGDRVELLALGHSSSEFLTFLNSRELALGNIIEVVSIEPYDGSVMVNYTNHQVEMLSTKVCERLLVKEIAS
jgi:DtxR family Mn-dependent transcriptional regulator